MQEAINHRLSKELIDMLEIRNKSFQVLMDLEELIRYIPNLSKSISNIAPFNKGTDDSKEIIRLMKIKKVYKGEILYREKEKRNRRIFFILQGKVGIVINNKEIGSDQNYTEYMRRKEEEKIQQIIDLKFTLDAMEIKNPMKRFINNTIQDKINFDAAQDKEIDLLEMRMITVKYGKLVRIVKENNMIGLDSFDKKFKRFATVLALSNCILIEFRARNIEKIENNTNLEEFKKRHDVLLNTIPNYGYNFSKNVKNLADGVPLRRFKRGDVICKKGFLIDHIIFIIEGEIGASITAGFRNIDQLMKDPEELEDEGKINWFEGLKIEKDVVKLIKSKAVEKEMLLFTIAKGELFGEESLIKKICVTDLKLFCLSDMVELYAFPTNEVAGFLPTKILERMKQNYPKKELFRRNMFQHKFLKNVEEITKGSLNSMLSSSSSYFGTLNSSFLLTSSNTLKKAEKKALEENKEKQEIRAKKILKNVKKMRKRRESTLLFSGRIPKNSRSKLSSILEAPSISQTMGSIELTTSKMTTRLNSTINFPGLHDSQNHVSAEFNPIYKLAKQQKMNRLNIKKVNHIKRLNDEVLVGNQLQVSKPKRIEFMPKRTIIETTEENIEKEMWKEKKISKLSRRRKKYIKVFGVKKAMKLNKQKLKEISEIGKEKLEQVSIMYNQLFKLSSARDTQKYDKGIKAEMRYTTPEPFRYKENYFKKKEILSHSLSLNRRPRNQEVQRKRRYKKKDFQKKLKRFVFKSINEKKLAALVQKRQILRRSCNQNRPFASTMRNEFT